MNNCLTCTKIGRCERMEDMMEMQKSISIARGIYHMFEKEYGNIVLGADGLKNCQPSCTMYDSAFELQNII